MIKKVLMAVGIVAIPLLKYLLYFIVHILGEAFFAIFDSFPLLKIIFVVVIFIIAWDW